MTAAVPHAFLACLLSPGMTLKTGMSRPNSPIIWLQKFRTPMTQSLKELLAAKAALDMEIAKARTSAADAALSKVQKLVTDFGFTQQQVFPYIPAKTSAPAKYRDPSTGATWTCLLYTSPSPRD